MSSSTPDVSSTPFQLGTKSSTNQIMLDDDNGTINEALDDINTDTNKAATTDANDNEGDGVEPDEIEEGNEKKKKAKDIFCLVGVQGSQSF